VQFTHWTGYFFLCFLIVSDLKRIIIFSEFLVFAIVYKIGEIFIFKINNAYFFPNLYFFRNEATRRGYEFPITS